MCVNDTKLYIYTFHSFHHISVFSARQHICHSAPYAIACLSVRHTDSSPMTSFLTLNFTGKVQREHRQRRRRIREGWEKYRIFSQ